MDITAQTDQFRTGGYVVFRNAIPAERIRASRRHIHAALPDALVAEKVLQVPTLKTDPVLRDITAGTAVADFLHTATAGAILPAEEAHVILRLPELDGPATACLEPHLDGTWNPLQEQRPYGTLHAFCAHLFVFLGPVERPEYGAFHVWPGSHLRVAHYIEEHGLEDLKTARDGGRAILSSLDLGEPVPLSGDAGDVVLCHHLMAHSGSPNFGSEIRYGMVTRQGQQGFLVARAEQYAEPFLQWPGI
ncbi:MAG: phytanoyl-CoA dioxygenase family protein [Candidatus Accumulibacter necessarius]|jgi:ectoine hydroxylase-related dioxygenase (phytanoyl-CoA dioxygenase family)